MRLDETLDAVHRKVTWDFKEGIDKVGRKETLKLIQEVLQKLASLPKSSDNSRTESEFYIQIAHYCLREASKAPNYLGGNEPLGKEAL